MGLAAPIASVVGGLGGALIGRSGQNRALQAQERATQAQLALEREREAARGRRYEQAYGDYRNEKTQYDQIRRALLGHYGINFGDTGGTPTPGAAKGSLGDLVSRGGLAPIGGTVPAMAGGVAPMEPVSEDVLDWRNYGA